MKTKRATELLNIELSRISAALTVARSFADEKGEIGKAIDEATKGCNEAWKQLQAIIDHARMI
jgi:hypothetical protein